MPWRDETTSSLLLLLLEWMKMMMKMMGGAFSCARCLAEKDLPSLFLHLRIRSSLCSDVLSHGTLVPSTGIALIVALAKKFESDARKAIKKICDNISRQANSTCFFWMELLDTAAVVGILFPIQPYSYLSV
mmetsp:Transcript_31565/g.76200  ORF Transcript_31565/g.76200 Transcript_31565/m.76200 type:complete len:131 (-) Transcript_31565:2024-2416(-)